MISIFVDESGADGGTRYMVHGALFLRNAAINGMRCAVTEILRNSGLVDELKWTTTSNFKLKRDLDAARCFFRVYGEGSSLSGPRFQCLVTDQHRLDIRHFHAGDADKCFYKLLYPLLLWRIGSYANPGEEVHVVLDHRSTKSYDLNELRDVLGHGLRKNLRDSAPVVKSVEYRDSKQEPLIQVADFLTGAVCFQRNARHLAPHASPAKVRAAEEVARMVGLPDLCGLDRRHDRFGIWTLRLTEVARRRG